MGFEARNGSKVDGGENKNTVDYEALNDYMIKTCGLQQEKTVVGIISGIIDLGLQEQDDGSIEWNGTPEQEAEVIKMYPSTYFQNKDGKRFKKWKKEPVNSIAITADFPGVIVDKAPFFGAESNPTPLRIIMNGKFWRKELKVIDIGRPYPLEIRKNDKTHNKWSFMPNNTLYKMAIGAGVISQGEPFLPQDIIKLLGKALLFKARVWKNEAGFYNEKAAYAAGLVDGMPVPEYDENLLFSVGFMSENDDKAIQFLSSPIINRMKMSSEYGNSEIRKQIEEMYPYQAIDDPSMKNDNASNNNPLENVPPSSSGGNNFPDPITDDDFDPDSVPF